MNKELSFSIGKFSKKTGVSIRTLHYYDEIGLLKAQKNPISGHRQYEEDHLVRLQKIVALKFLGYNLEEIGLMLKDTYLNLSLHKSLLQQRKAFEKKKQHLDNVLKAINRTFSFEENLSLDKEFIDLSKEVKRLAGKSVQDPEVQELAK